MFYKKGQTIHLKFTNDNIGEGDYFISVDMVKQKRVYFRYKYIIEGKDGEVTVIRGEHIFSIEQMNTLINQPSLRVVSNNLNNLFPDNMFIVN